MTEPDNNYMNFQKILELVEEITEVDGEREEILKAELDQADDMMGVKFDRTRALLNRQRDNVSELREMLEREHKEIKRLRDATDHFTVEQAVRNREATLSKLETHVDCLEQFCDEVERVIETVEHNIEHFDDRTELKDASEHQQAAKAALEEHNEAIAGLEKNLTIVSTYLR